MKISLLSVAPPYRGGISEQTYHLYNQLKNNHSVDIINFYKEGSCIDIRSYFGVCINGPYLQINDPAPYVHCLYFHQANK